MHLKYLLIPAIVFCGCNNGSEEKSNNLIPQVKSSQNLNLKSPGPNISLNTDVDEKAKAVEALAAARKESGEESNNRIPKGASSQNLIYKSPGPNTSLNPDVKAKAAADPVELVESRKIAQTVVKYWASQFKWIKTSCNFESVRKVLLQGDTTLIHGVYERFDDGMSGLSWKRGCEHLANLGEIKDEAAIVKALNAAMTPAGSDRNSIEDYIMAFENDISRRNLLLNSLRNAQLTEDMVQLINRAASLCRTKDNWSGISDSLVALSKHPDQSSGDALTCFKKVIAGRECMFKLTEFEAVLLLRESARKLYSDQAKRYHWVNQVSCDHARALRELEKKSAEFLNDFTALMSGEISPIGWIYTCIGVYSSDEDFNRSVRLFLSMESDPRFYDLVLRSLAVVDPIKYRGWAVGEFLKKVELDNQFTRTLLVAIKRCNSLERWNSVMTTLLAMRDRPGSAAVEDAATACFVNVSRGEECKFVMPPVFDNALLSEGQEIQERADSMGLGNFDWRDFDHVIVIPDVNGDDESFILSLWKGFCAVEYRFIEFDAFDEALRRVAAGVEFTSESHSPVKYDVPHEGAKLSRQGQRVAVVQLGNLITQGSNSYLCMQILASIEEVIGYKVIFTLGNQESQMLKLARSVDTRPQFKKYSLEYMDEDDRKRFPGDGSSETLAAIFAPTGAISNFLVQTGLVLARIGGPVTDSEKPYMIDPEGSPDTLFVHGGLELLWLWNAVDPKEVPRSLFGTLNGLSPKQPSYSVDDMKRFQEIKFDWKTLISSVNSQERRNFVDPQCPLLQSELMQGPCWTRRYSEAPRRVKADKKKLCEELDEVMKRLRVSRIVAGHEHLSNNRVRTFCDNKFIISHVMLGRGVSMDQPNQHLALVMSFKYKRLSSIVAHYASHATNGYEAIVPLLRNPVVSMVLHAMPASPVPIPFQLPSYAIESAMVHESIRPFFVELMASDKNNVKSTPYLIYDGEILPGDRRIKIGDRIARQPFAMVFHIGNDGNQVIKYELICYKNAGVVPEIMRDFWFLREAAKLGVSPPVEFLSPPAKLPPYKKPKTDFQSEYLKDCLEGSDSHVRYMVMGRIEKTVADLMRQEDMPIEERFVLGLKMGVSVLAKIKELHDKDIIHGEVCPGNIALLDGTDNFGLIDFGRAKFVSELVPGTKLSSPQAGGCYTTFYQMDGFGYSFRDDVILAVEAVAFLMTGLAVVKKCYAFHQDNKKMYEFHKSGSLFEEFDGGVLKAMLEGFSSEKARHILNRLKAVLHLGRSVKDVGSRPDYDKISKYFSEALAIYEGRLLEPIQEVPQDDLTS